MPRFRIRTLIIAVAIVGTAMGLGARRASFQRQADFYWAKLDLVCGSYRPETPAELAEARRQSHYAKLWMKYKYAASDPWLPVPPDPPEPD